MSRPMALATLSRSTTPTPPTGLSAALSALDAVGSGEVFPQPVNVTSRPHKAATEILCSMSGSFPGRNDENATLQRARREDSQSCELSPDGNMRHQRVVGWT